MGDEFFFAKVPLSILAMDNLSNGAKCVYAGLDSFTDNKTKGNVCWPSIPTLAGRVGRGVTQVTGYIAELEWLRLVNVERTPGRANRYTLLRAVPPVPCANYPIGMSGVVNPTGTSGVAANGDGGDPTGHTDDTPSDIPVHYPIGHTGDEVDPEEVDPEKQSTFVRQTAFDVPPVSIHEDMDNAELQAIQRRAQTRDSLSDEDRDQHRDLRDKEGKAVADAWLDDAMTQVRATTFASLPDTQKARLNQVYAQKKNLDNRHARRLVDARTRHRPRSTYVSLEELQRQSEEWRLNVR